MAGYGPQGSVKYGTKGYAAQKGGPQGPGAKGQPWGQQQQGQRGYGNQRGGWGARGGRWGQRGGRWNDQGRNKTRLPSITVRPDWVVGEEFDFARLLVSMTFFCRFVWLFYVFHCFQKLNFKPLTDSSAADEKLDFGMDM